MCLGTALSLLDNEPEIGLVNGLAWTSVGGELLEIEVEALKGTGQLQLPKSRRCYAGKRTHCYYVHPRTLPNWD